MAAPEARQPALAVLVNGVPIGGVFEACIDSTSHLSADRFQVRAALSASGADAWSGAPLAVEIRIGLNGSYASLITGRGDLVTIDPVHGVVEVSGRDLASLFVASQIDESFENRTSSDIASLLAARQGLDAAVTPTQTLIGRYYQSSRTRTALTQHARVTTHWDLLCWLAQLENYDLWVGGQTLYFQPATAPADMLPVSPPDCLSMRLSHALDVADGVSVTVKSWDCIAQQAVAQTVSSAAGGAVGQTRIVVRPNLSSTDAQGLAAQIVSQISAHERSIVFEMPGDLVTTPRMGVALSGTATDFDGRYRVCAIERRFSIARGFVQTIEARSLPWTAS